MRRLLLALLGSVLFGAAPAAATVIVGPIHNPATGHNYLLLDQTSWTAAQAEEITLGGHLATVNDAAENSFIFTTFDPFITPGIGVMWIGFNDAAVEGTFVWANGEPVTYTNWRAVEPNNAGPVGNEDYAAITGSLNVTPGEWVDLHNSASGLPFAVVEIVPEAVPTTSEWALIVLVLLLLTALTVSTAVGRRLTAAQPD